LKKWLKEIVVTALLIIIATSAIGYFRSSSVEAKSSFEVLKNKTSIDGKSINALLEQKKPLVVNFWGTWCPVCNQEVSTIDKIAKDKSIVLITVAVNSGLDSDIKSYMQKKGVDFLVINDNKGAIAKAFNITTYPTTIFYSPNRQKVIKDSGYLSYLGYLARKKLVEN